MADDIMLKGLALLLLPSSKQAKSSQHVRNVLALSSLELGTGILTGKCVQSIQLYFKTKQKQYH